MSARKQRTPVPSPHRASTFSGRKQKPTPSPAPVPLPVGFVPLPTHKEVIAQFDDAWRRNEGLLSRFPGTAAGFVPPPFPTREQMAAHYVAANAPRLPSFNDPPPVRDRPEPHPSIPVDMWKVKCAVKDLIKMHRFIEDREAEIEEMNPAKWLLYMGFDRNKFREMYKDLCKAVGMDRDDMEDEVDKEEKEREDEQDREDEEDRKFEEDRRKWQESARKYEESRRNPEEEERRRVQNEEEWADYMRKLGDSNGFDGSTWKKR